MTTNSFSANSRTHDLLAVCIGAFAAVVLATSPLNVDTSGPDPFYKGPLIFPLLVLSLMILAAVPAAWRLLRGVPGARWYLDGAGWPVKTLLVLGLLVAQLCCLPIIGLEASGLIFLVAALYLLGVRQPARLFVLPLVVNGLLVLVFKYMLDVWFPTPLLVEWLGG